MTHTDLHDPEKFQSQLLPLFFLTSIFFLNFTIRIIISPLLPTIAEDMALSRDQAGSFFLISASGYFIALLCSGFVSSRLLHKKTIALAAMGSGAAIMAAGLSQNLMAMRLGLFGVGPGLCAVSSLGHRHPDLIHGHPELGKSHRHS